MLNSFRAFVKGVANKRWSRHARSVGCAIFFISTLALTASGDFGAQTNVFWNVSRCGQQRVPRRLGLRRVQADKKPTLIRERHVPRATRTASENNKVFSYRNVMLIADPFSLRTPIYSDRCFVGTIEPRERYVDCVFLYDREFFKHVATCSHFRTRQ